MARVPAASGLLRAGGFRRVTALLRRIGGGLASTSPDDDRYDDGSRVASRLAFPSARHHSALVWLLLTTLWLALPGEAEAQTSCTPTCITPTEIYEGETLDFIFHATYDFDSFGAFNISITGTAARGTDFQTIDSYGAVLPDNSFDHGDFDALGNNRFGLRIRALTDSLSEGDETITLGTGGYDTPVTITLKDGTRPATDGVTLSKTLVRVTELGGTSATDTYTVKLNTDPGASVSVTVTVPSAHRDAVSLQAPGGTAGHTATLSFTGGSSGNWATAQTVTVRALNDSDLVAENVELVHTASAPSGNAYNGITVGSVHVVVTEVGRGIVLEPTTLQVYVGDTAIYKLRLRSPPGGTVVITPSSSHTANATVTSQAKTFTNSDWDEFQTVTVTGVAARNGVTISHAVTTATTNYGTITPLTSLTANVVADTRPVVSIAAQGGATSIVEGNTAVLQVTRTGATTSALSVNIANPVYSTGFSGASVTSDFDVNVGFSTASFPLIIFGDSTDEPNGTVTVSLASNAAYKISTAAGSVTLAIIDDDATSVTLARSGSAAIAEGGGMADFTVTLGRRLGADEDVTAPLTVTGVQATDYTLALKTGTGLNEGVTLDITSPHSAAAPAVKFAGHATNAVQTATLTLTAVQDTTDEGASETATVGFGTSTRAVTSNLDRASGTGTGGTSTTGTVAVVITDDDDSVVTVSKVADGVSEAANRSAVFSVDISAAQTAAVPFKACLTATPSDAGLMGVGRTLDDSGCFKATIAANATFELISFNAPNDTADTPDRVLTLTVSVDPDSPLPAGVAISSTAASATAKLTDDDPTVASLARVGTGAVTEGGDIEFTVTLSRALLAGEVIDVPLIYSGTGINEVDLEALALKSGASLNAGVSLLTQLPTLVPVVRFTGHSTNMVRVATLEQSVKADGAAEAGGETLNVALGPDGTGNHGFDASSRGTNVGGGADPHATANEFDVTLNDPPPIAVSLTANATTVAEGGTLTVTATLGSNASSAVSIPVRRKATGSTAATTDFSLSNSGVIAITSGQSTGTVTFTATADTADEPSETAIVEFGTLPAGYGAGSPSEVTVTITDDDPTVASLARVGTGAVTEGDDVEFTVTLGRNLIAGEIVDVPLVLSGTGITTADLDDLALKTGTGLNSGVSLVGAGTLAPVVRFTGHNTNTVQVATLLLGATDDSTAETGGETLSVALGPDDTSANGFDRTTPARNTNVGGGANPHTTADDFDVTLNDPAATALVSVTQLVDGNEITTAGFSVRISARQTVAVPYKACLTATHSDAGLRATAGTTVKTLDDSGCFTSTIAANQQDDIIVIDAPTDIVDTPDRVVTLTVSADPDNALPAGVAISSTAASATTNLKDNDPTVVSLARVGTGAVTEGGDVEFTVTLGRNLIAGEIVDVPLVLSGAGITTADLDDLALKTGTGLNSGVSLVGAGTLAPVVRFTGHNTNTVQVATLQLGATNDSTAESGGETLNVALGPDDTSANGFDRTSPARQTNVGGGANPHATANDFDVTLNDPAANAVNLSVSGGGTVAEGGTLTVTATLGSNAVAAVSIPVRRKATGSTAATTDFSLSNSGVIAITSGQNTGTVTFTATADTVDEPSETAIVEFGTLPAGYTAGSSSEVTVTITDDDPTVASLARVGTGAVTEGGDIEFTVTLGRNLVAGEIVDVPLVLSGTGIMTADLDSMVLKSGAGLNRGVTLINPATLTPVLRFTGHNTNTVQVATLLLGTTDDSTAEAGGETLNVALGPDDTSANGFDRTSPARQTNVGGGANPHATADDFNVALNDLVLPEISVAVVGGHTSNTEGGSPLTLRVTRTGATTSTLTVVVNRPVFSTGFSGGIAGSSSDILTGNTFVDLELTFTGDSIDEPDGTVTWGPTADATYRISSTAGSVRLNILDDDPTVVNLARVGTGAVTEGGDVEFTVTLGRKLIQGEIIDVPLVLSGTGITAADLDDLALKSGSGLNAGVTLVNPGTLAPVVRFTGAGTLSTSTVQTATLLLGATSDSTAEAGGETLNVALGPDDTSANGFDRTSPARQTNVGGGADPHASNNSFAVTLNDPVILKAVRLTADATTVVEGGTVTVTATLDSNASSAVSIPVRRKAAGSTTAATDFSLSNSGAITIASGQNTGSVTFTATDDTVDEPSETAIVEFGTLPSGYAAGTPAEVTVTITDNDPTVASLVRTGSGVVGEGNVVAFTVQLGRKLIAGEVIDVPLVLSGVQAADLGQLSARIGRSLNAGVALVGANSLSPVVRFSGASDLSGSRVRTATLELLVSVDTEVEAETLTVALGPNGSGPNGFDRSGRATNVAGGVDPHASANTFAVALSDTPPAVTLSGPSTVVEGGPAEYFTLGISPAAPVSVRVPLRVEALDPGLTKADFQWFRARLGRDGSFTIPAGSSGTVLVPFYAHVDDEVEGPERLRLSIVTSGLPGSVVPGEITEQVVEIWDADPGAPVVRPRVSFVGGSSGSACCAVQEVHEGDGQAVLRVRVDPPAPWPLTLRYTLSGTATQGADWRVASRTPRPWGAPAVSHTGHPVQAYGAVTVPARARSAAIAVDIVDDPVEDSGETLIAELVSGAGYSEDRTFAMTLTIRNDEDGTVPKLLVSGIGDVVVRENALWRVKLQTDGATGAVTWALSGADAHAFALNTVTGAVSLPAQDFEAPSDTDGDNVYEATVTASDEDGATASVSFTVTVSDELEAVLAVAGLADATVAENEAWQGQATATGANGTVSWVLSGTPGNTFRLDAATGEVSLPAQDFEAPADANRDNVYEATVTATDAGGATASISFTVTVTDVDEAVLAVTGLADATVAENEAWQGQVTVTDANGTVSWTLTGADASDFTIDATTGAVSLPAQDFEVPADANGDNVYEGTVTATDAGGATASISFTVTVTDVAEGVQAQVVLRIASGASVLEGGKAAFTLTTHTAPSADLVVKVEVDQQGAWLAPGEAGRRTVTLPAGRTSQTFEIVTVDDTAVEANGKVTATLVAGSGYTLATSEHSARVLVGDDDAADAETRSVDKPEVIAVTHESVTVEWPRPAGDHTGYEVRWWETADKEGTKTSAASATTRFTVTGIKFGTQHVIRVFTVYPTRTWRASAPLYVTTLGEPLAQAQPPVVPLLSLASEGDVTEGAEASFLVSASTAPSADLAVTVEVAQSDGRVASGDIGLRVVTLKAGTTSVAVKVATVDDTADGPDGTVTLHLVAGSGYTLAASPSDAATVAVVDDDDPLAIAGLGNATVVENEAWQTTPTATGAVGAVAWALSGADAGVFTLDAATGVVELSARNFEVPADADADNVYEATVTATDANGATDSVSFTVTVTDVDEAVLAVAGIEDGQVSENEAWQGQATATGATGTVSWALSGADAGVFTLYATTGAVELPAQDFEAPADADADNVYEATVTATDANGATASVSFTVTVTDVDETVLAVAGIEDGQVAENEAWQGQATATGATGVVSWTLSGADAGVFAIDTGTGAVTLPAQDFEVPADADADNVYEATVEATDEGGATDSVSFAVTVTDVPEVAVAGLADTSAEENAIWRGQATASGATGVVTWRLSGDDGGVFELDAATGAVTLPAQDFEAPVDTDADNVYEATVTATDEGGATDSVSFAVTVTDVAELEVSGPSGEQVAENAAWQGQATATGATGAVTWTLSGDDASAFELDAASGAVTLPAQDFEVPADADADNVYEATVTATDEDGATDSVSFAVTVTDVDEGGSGLTLAVSDASAHENAREQLVFSIALNRRLVAGESVSVDYATRDVTATARKDYWPQSGRLTFRPGEQSLEFYVWVENDAHDEGDETMEMVLANAAGASIADGVGVGTIRNDDPLPAAWLSRFGRSVGQQALDAVAGRVASPRAEGFRATLAGQPLEAVEGVRGADDARAGRSEDAAPDRARGEAAEAFAEVAWRFGGGTGMPGAGMNPADTAWGPPHAGGSHDGPPALGGIPAHLPSVPGTGLAAGLDASMTLSEVLAGSSFGWNGREDASGGTPALWGSAAQARFAGQDGELSLDGELGTALVGADYARESWLAGMMLSRTDASGGYDGDGPGRIEAALTAATAYGAYEASTRAIIWGAAGHGAGRLTLTPGENPDQRAFPGLLSLPLAGAVGETAVAGSPIHTDLGWSMAAAGARAALPSPFGRGGPALALVSDALWTRTASKETEGLAASATRTTRLRFGIEGGWSLRFAGGSLRPELALGVRSDGGDAETGFGVETDGGVAWTHRQLGLALDVRGRTLLSHQDDGFEDRGLFASLALDPDMDGFGPSFTLRQESGGPAGGGLDVLFSPELSGVGHGVRATSRWTAEVGWGLPAFGARFAGTPHLGYGTSAFGRDYSVGWRITGAGESAPDVEFGVLAVRRGSLDDVPTHGLEIALGARDWWFGRTPALLRELAFALRLGLLTRQGEEPEPGAGVEYQVRF